MSWRTFKRALLLAWAPTWRFFDAPDTFIEVRATPHSDWSSLTCAPNFHWWNVLVAPGLVDQMWSVGRVRALLEKASEAASLGDDVHVLGGLIARILAERNEGFEPYGWALRTRDAMDGSVCLEIYGPRTKAKSGADLIDLCSHLSGAATELGRGD